MTFDKRIPIYFLLSVIGAIGFAWWQVELSQAELVNDPSAMAWIGFLPFFVSIFWAYSVVVVCVVAIVVETLIWIVPRVLKADRTL